MSSFGAIPGEDPFLRSTPGLRCDLADWRQQAGDKRWYKTHLPIADERFRRHLEGLEQEEVRELMAVRFDDYMAKLPKKRQQAIKKRTAKLIAEEATGCAQLRQARERLAKKKVCQEATHQAGGGLKARTPRLICI